MWSGSSISHRPRDRCCGSAQAEEPVVGGVWIHRGIDGRQRFDRVLHIWIVPGTGDEGIRMGSGHVLLDTARRPRMCGGGISLSRPRHRSLRDSSGLADVHCALRAVAGLAVADPSLAGCVHRDGRPGRTAQRWAAPLPYAKAVSSWFDERRGLALGIAMTGIGIGATLVPQFARAVIDAYGWRAGYVALAALMFSVAFPVVAIFIREPTATCARSSTATASFRG